jgi:uncharacterized membrane protein
VAAAVTRERAGVHDERGLVGKLLVVWLVLLALLVLAGIDAASIVLTKVKTSAAADKAAIRGATVFHVKDSRRDALAAALEQLGEDMPSAEMRPEDFVIDPPTGRVTVTVTAKASTLIVDRVDFLSSYARISETSTATPPEL